jgi:hypothetical protein
VFLTEIVDHGGRRSDAMRALAQWRYPLSLSEAQDVLHWEMHPTSHHRIRMSIKIACDLPAFFVVVDSLFAHNVS